MLTNKIIPASPPNSAKETRLGSQQCIDQGGKHWLVRIAAACLTIQANSLILDRWGCLRCPPFFPALHESPRKLQCLSIPFVSILWLIRPSILTFLDSKAPKFVASGVTGQILRHRVPILRHRLAIFDDYPPSQVIHNIATREEQIGHRLSISPLFNHCWKTKGSIFDSPIF